MKEIKHVDEIGVTWDDLKLSKNDIVAIAQNNYSFSNSISFYPKWADQEISYSCVAIFKIKAWKY